MIWLTSIRTAIGLPNWVPPKYGKICENHFPNYVIGAKNARKGKSLPIDAVPIINPEMLKKVRYRCVPIL
jgi:hypothetical protein